MKSVLITGVAGFIGSHVAKRFLKEGYKVKLLLRKSSVTPESLNKCEKALISLNDPNNSSADLPNSSFIARLASLILNDGRLSWSSERSSAIRPPIRSGRTDKACPNFKSEDPLKAFKIHKI